MLAWAGVPPGLRAALLPSSLVLVLLSTSMVVIGTSATGMQCCENAVAWCGGAVVALAVSPAHCAGGGTAATAAAAAAEAAAAVVVGTLRSGGAVAGAVERDVAALGLERRGLNEHLAVCAITFSSLRCS